METDICASSGIRTHVSRIRAREDIHILDRAATVIGKAYLKEENLSFIWRITNTQPPRDVWAMSNILLRYQTI
jgi:hypothetical protein